MTYDRDNQAELEKYFFNEATEMLLTIEQILLSLLEEKTTDKVHTLMRSAHTLKGSAANVGLTTIETIAHHLEDVFQALYPEEVEIDPELSSLLLDGYECLRSPLSAILSNLPYDETAILDRTASVFAKLQAKLGDFFGREAPLPSSEELGFDVVGSIFADSIPEDLQQLEETIASWEIDQIEEVLRSQAEFFLDLGASYNLPGLEEIAKYTLVALDEQPEQTTEIAKAALENFQQSYQAVMAGDRTTGGQVSAQLQDLAGITSSPIPANAEVEYFDETSLVSPTEQIPEPLRTQITQIANNQNGTQIFSQETAGSQKQVENSNSLAPISAVEGIFQSILTEDSETTDEGEEVFLGEKSEISSAKIVKDRQIIAENIEVPTIRVPKEKLDRLSKTIAELIIKENQQNLKSEQLHQNTKETLEQFIRCQKQLSQIGNWSEKNQLYPKRKRRQQDEIKQQKDLSERFIQLGSHQYQFDELEMDAYTEFHLLVQNLTENMKLLGERMELLETEMGQYRFHTSKGKRLLDSASEDLFQARMVPIAIVFNRLPRLVQQMIATYRKQAELELIGREILADKAICDKLYDPLLHLIRNAYDHGLEDLETRRQKGKPEIGKIAVRAYQQGNRTTIEVEDDGRGLNWERIRTKAIENNLLSSAEAASTTEEELAELLFEPGFSTADKIGELSGRGVGLDVVRSQLQAMEGQVSISSIFGRGTTFIMQLPLQLTRARLLICQCQGITYGLLYESIARVILPQPEQIQQQKSLSGKEAQIFFCWEEADDKQLIPIRSLVDLLSYQYIPFPQQQNSNLSVFPIEEKNRVLPLLMLEIDGQRLLLQVDRILLEEELIVKSLGSCPTLPSYIQGYSVLADGSLTLAIDPVELVAEVWENTLNSSSALPELPTVGTLTTSSALEPRTKAILPTNEDIEIVDAILTDDPPTLPPRFLKILAVDDSIVQRQNLANTLRKAGYQILQAANGTDAIAVLEKNLDINLVICDIEMPYMNGFEFLGYCHQDPRFSQIPIVMLTTRSGDKHRKFALALGAKEYLTKPYSNEELLNTVAKLLNVQSQIIY